MRRVLGFMACSAIAALISMPTSTNSLAGRVILERAQHSLMQQHDALAYSLESGYSFDHDWKPRASLYYGLRHRR